jgi:hypothetical protein
MSYSSLMGADTAPAIPSGRSGDLLGPSDNSDSGSDAVGSSEVHGDSDSSGTGERGEASGLDTKEGGDILPDRVVRIGGSEANAGPWSDDEVFTDLDEDTTTEDSMEALGEAAEGDIERDRRARRGSNLPAHGSPPDSEPGQGIGVGEI